MLWGCYVDLEASKTGIQWFESAFKLTISICP